LVVGGAFLGGEVEIPMIRNALQDAREAGAADALLARHENLHAGDFQGLDDGSILRDPDDAARAGEPDFECDVTNVKRVVLAHIWDVGEEDVAEIKKYYSGKVLVGRDLLVRSCW